jgi:glycosyltransferase involved in cell wall biosynthesis
MKNREGVLRIFALTKEQWAGQLVFAGEPLTDDLRSLGEQLGISHRIVEVTTPSSELLEALYSCALVLLYPSRFEGFGWPIIEAQACGCPVICANREPMCSVAGEAALTADVEDERIMAQHLLSLTNSQERDRWAEKSIRNSQRYSTDKMIDEYIALYRSVGMSF